MEEGCVVVNKGEDRDLIDLPPGFRFHPTDEEIITCYLTEKVKNCNFSASAIGEADLNKCEPWDLPKKAKMGEKEWYFFCQRDRKYPTGMRTNRATESGYWKATGKDKEIFKGKGTLVGMKKTLVFYRGRAPKGEKTNWVMHEYRLEGKFSYYNLPKSAKDEWVVCRIFHKNMGNIKKNPSIQDSYFGEDVSDSSSLPPLMENPSSSSYKLNYGDEFKATQSNPSTISSYYATGMNDLDLRQQKQQLANEASFQPRMISTNNPIQNPDYSFSQMIPVVPNPIYNPSFHANSNPGLYQQVSSYGTNSINQIMSSRAFVGNNNGGNLSGFEQMTMPCKVEQFSMSVGVSLSQDTGLSTDMNNTGAEISSTVVSKQDAGRNVSYEEFEGPSPSVVGISDMDSFWDGL
ncbi:hypothetical protein UlMin_006807 [Ulmus minor]